MKTSELLDHIAGEMLDDRTDLISGANDQLFSDTRIIRFLNEAERIYARTAWVLEDTNPASNDGATPTPGYPCQIQLVLNTTDYALHKSVLHVKSARLSDTDVDLLRVGYEDNHLWQTAYVVDPDFWDVNLPLTETAGRPQRYSLDMGTRLMRVRRKPDATSAALKVNLVVVRMPLVDMSTDDLDKEPEIPAEFHLDLSLFAAGACLTRTADIDASLRKLGEGWMADFDARVATARKERQRFKQSAPRFRFGGWVGSDARDAGSPSR